MAVLPFDIGQADEHVEYLSDEVAEGIINRLSDIGDLRVMAWSIVEKLKGSAADPMTTGRDLGVDAVLTGRVTVRDGMVNVQASLIDSRRGFQIWGDKFEHPFVSAASFQEEVTRNIAQRLGLQLPEPQEPLPEQAASDPEAYKFYLEGRHFGRMQKEQERKVQELEQQQQQAAAQQEPPAHEGQDSQSARQEQEAARQEAQEDRDAARRDMRQEKAELAQQEWKKEAEMWTARIESFRHALDIDGNFVMAQQGLAEALAAAGISGKVDAQAVMPHAKEAAARLIEMDKSSGKAYVMLGGVYSRWERNWKRAGELLHKAVELNPRSASAHHRYAISPPAGRVHR